MKLPENHSRLIEKYPNTLLLYGNENNGYTGYNEQAQTISEITGTPTEAGEITTVQLYNSNVFLPMLIKAGHKVALVTML